MRSVLFVSTLAGLLLSGCNSSKTVSDNAQASDLIRLEVTNWSMVGDVPPGLIVEVPKGCKKVPRIPENLMPKSSKQYNVPVDIVTDKGARLIWFLAVATDEKARKELDEARRMPMQSGSQAFHIGNWQGEIMLPRKDSQETMDNLDKSSPKAESQTYLMFREDEELMVNARWPKGNAAAKASGIAAAESFVKTVEIDPSPKRIDFFPGAGEEPNAPVPKDTEIAMPDGMTLEATTKVGVMKIHAGPGLKRSYTWEGDTRFVIMQPRGERWYGSKGMYYPGPGDHWEEHNGITRGVVEEGQQNFDDEAAALKWLKERAYESPVWTKTGLVVGWMKVLDRRQLSVEVWQITIKHKKPTNLLGSNDDAIKFVSE